MDKFNLEIRTARIEDSPGIARVHVDSWRTTYRGIVPQDVLENLSYQQRQEIWQERLTNIAQTGRHSQRISQ